MLYICLNCSYPIVFFHKLLFEITFPMAAFLSDDVATYCYCVILFVFMHILGRKNKSLVSLSLCVIYLMSEGYDTHDVLLLFDNILCYARFCHFSLRL